MKLLIPALAAVALAGCASYDEPVYAVGTTTYYATAPAATYYVAPAPVTVQRIGRVDPNDRDGDGVPNWRDRDPDDPRYH